MSCNKVNKPVVNILPIDIFSINQYNREAFFSLFLFRVEDEVLRSAFAVTGLDFSKVTHLLYKYPDF